MNRFELKDKEEEGCASVAFGAAACIHLIVSICVICVYEKIFSTSIDNV